MDREKKVFVEYREAQRSSKSAKGLNRKKARGAMIRAG